MKVKEVVNTYVHSKRLISLVYSVFVSEGPAARGVQSM